MTNGRRGALSESEELGAQADVTASPAEFGFVFEDDFVFAVKPGEEFMNEIEANESGTVDADEEFGIERILEVVERAAKRVRLGSAMKQDVVAIGFDPGDFINGSEAGAVVVFDEDAIGVSALFLDGLEDFGKTRGERASGT